MCLPRVGPLAAESFVHELGFLKGAPTFLRVRPVCPRGSARLLEWPDPSLPLAQEQLSEQQPRTGDRYHQEVLPRSLCLSIEWEHLFPQTAAPFSEQSEVLSLLPSLASAGEGHEPIVIVVIAFVAVSPGEKSLVLAAPA